MKKIRFNREMKAVIDTDDKKILFPPVISVGAAAMGYRFFGKGV